MKIFRAEQIRAIDAATIREEPVSSVDLMERASRALFRWVSENYNRDRHFFVFAGTGNNGGDALALARMLVNDGYRVRVFIVTAGGSFSSDMQTNLERLKKSGIVPSFIREQEEIPAIPGDATVIDGIFGSGLTRTVTGISADVIRTINHHGSDILSVDIPSGLFCDKLPQSDTEAVVRANHTLTFQFPKLSFMTEEGNRYTGHWEVLDIGLSPDAIVSETTPYYYVAAGDIKPLIRRRGKFDHKGTFGHALIIAGSYGKAGAAILASAAALRTGAGLVTCHLPGRCVTPLQCSMPEVMASPDEGDEHIVSMPEMERFSAVGIGPGMGTDPDTRKALAGMLSSFRNPVVIDADAINILALEPDMISLLPPNSILTPHPGEFNRLTGVKNAGLDRINLQREFAGRYKCIVVLKGANTTVALPDGRVFFNSSGNPGMATAGSGDVLAGMITSLLAQGYTPADAAVTGVFMHGMAGDIALETHSQQSLIAGDIIRCIGSAFNKTEEQPE